MKYLIDGNYFVSREDGYDYLVEVFNFPDYFGHNLDALWDILSFEKDLEIEILHGRMILKNLGEYGIRILDVFGDLNEIDGNAVKIYW